MNRILPDHPMQRMPEDATVFSVPNPVHRVSVTPALAAQAGQAAISPQLLGVEIDGHYAVVYSPFGLAGGWEMSQSPYALGYSDFGAIQLGQNILMYAVTQ